MSRHVTPCHVMYLMSRHGTSCHVMSYYVMSHHVTSCHVMSHLALSCHVMSYHVTSYHVESRGTVTRPTLHCQLTSSTRNQFKLSMTVFVGCPKGCRYNTASAVYDLVIIISSSSSRRGYYLWLSPSIESDRLWRMATLPFCLLPFCLQLPLATASGEYIENQIVVYPIDLVANLQRDRILFLWYDCKSSSSSSINKQIVPNNKILRSRGLITWFDLTTSCCHL